MDGNGASRAAKGHIDDVRAHLVGIQNRLGNVRLIEHAAGLTGFDCHDFYVVGNADNAFFIVCGGNDACNVRAVAVVVHGIARHAVCAAVVGNDVRAVYVVYVAVAVIVNAVAGDFFGVDPHAGS